MSREETISIPMSAMTFGELVKAFEYFLPSAYYAVDHYLPDEKLADDHQSIRETQK